MARSLGAMENHAFFIIFLSFIMIVFWHAIWELLTEFTDTVHTRHGIAKWKIYVGSLVLVLLFIGVYPKILDKI